VKGKVTFPDGTPLTRGDVQFMTPTIVASGTIQPDGTYIIGSKKNNDGLPKGTYTVTVRAHEEIGSDVKIPDTVSDARVDAGKRPVQVPSLIDLKYSSPESSGLSCNVQGATVFNITVEPFTR
jgi:hypothetical protein